MKKLFLQVGTALNKAQLQKIHGGFAPCNSPSDCADAYNKTAFDPLPPSAFNCRNGSCEFA